MNGAVMVVDSDLAFLRKVKAELNRDGYTVYCVRRIENVETILYRKDIDILIVDLAQQSIGIVRLVSKAQKINPLIGTIIIGNQPEMQLDTLLRLLSSGGTCSAMVKPFSPSDLIDVVSNMYRKLDASRECMTLKTLLPLLDMTKTMSSELQIQKMYRYVTHVVGIAVKCDDVQLLLYDDDNKQLVTNATSGKGEVLEGKAVSVTDDPIAWSVLNSGKYIIQAGQNTNDGTAVNNTSSHTLCVPMMIKNKITGVINCRRSGHLAEFKESDLELCSIIATQVAISIENARMFECISRQKEITERYLKKVLTAQEEERKRISSELHDGLAQDMVGAFYATQLCETFMDMEKLDDAKLEVKRAQEILDRSIKCLRRVILDLHPAILEKMGLLEALRRTVSTFGEENGIKTEFQVIGESTDLPIIQEVVIYRTVQEALNNVQKHSKARAVKVVLRYTNSNVSIKINDNGVGFRASAIEKHMVMKGSMGLVNMRERVESAGGVLKVNSACGAGTEISMRLPVAAGVAS